MSSFPRPVRGVASVLCAAVVVLSTFEAGAQDGATATREAIKHFERGVALYGEADYRAALVEFKRAYGIAPNTAVLYNVGEAQYQLQDYAGALTTFTRYLAECGPSDTHRAEVEGNVDVLRARVGRVSIATAPAGADVSIDDQPVGRTPLEEKVLVSVGRRKVMASLGGSVVTRYVDVAAEDNLSVTLDLSAIGGADASASTGGLGPARQGPSTSPPPSSGSVLPLLGWLGTGVLAAGAGISGALALKESTDLKNLRSTYPVSAATLNHDATLVTTYSILADSLGAAALVLGGVTLVSTLLYSSRAGRRADAAVRVSIGPGSVRLETFF